MDSAGLFSKILCLTLGVFEVSSRVYFICRYFTALRFYYKGEEMNYNSEIVLRSGRSKYFRSLLSSLAFTAFGIKLAMQSHSAIGWVIAIVFGFAALASLIPILPNQSYLKLDKYGFTIRSMFQTNKIRWNEVENFEAQKRYSKRSVVYSFLKKKRNYVNVENLVGKQEMLPDIYGMEAHALAELMEDFRIRYSYPRLVVREELSAWN